MISEATYIVYPEGDTQEISHHLQINQLTDLNGFPLRMPIPTTKMIVYRVYKKTTKEAPGEIGIFFHLELVGIDELSEFTC